MAIEITVERESRPLLQAVWNGMRCRCPKCGEGKLFRAYLKVNDACPACGEQLHHHRADDLPPYLVIFVVGHVVGWGMLTAEMSYAAPLWFHLAVWPALTLVLALARPQRGEAVADMLRLPHGKGTFTGCDGQGVHG
mgnify:CR=1 FL=1